MSMLVDGSLADFSLCPPLFPPPMFISSTFSNPRPSSLFSVLAVLALPSTPTLSWLLPGLLDEPFFRFMSRSRKGENIEAKGVGRLKRQRRHCAAGYHLLCRSLEEIIL